MKSLLSRIEGTIDNLENRQNTFDPYFYFEPWDCEIPTPDTVKKAIEDGVSLTDDESIKLAGEYPRLFQTGSTLSTKRIVVTQAGSRSGKTICTQVVIGAMISRRPPYSMRYDPGVDTGIKRMINVENIRRFGRRSVETGLILDHSEKEPVTSAWDCGNIVGVGVFPEELYCPKGKQIWIGTIAKSVDTLWWPSFTGEGEARFFPQEFIDSEKGNGGFNKNSGIVHAIHDIDIHIKTFEQGRTKFESQTCWLLAYDEEPPDKSIFVSGTGHAVYQRFSFTPLNGKTWSEETFFNCVRGTKLKGGLRRSDFDYYYASQFDSPYREKEKLLMDRRAMALHERKAVIWGQYSEYTGEPFFNRSRIQVWRKEFRHPYKDMRFFPLSPYFGVNGSVVENLPGILAVEVSAEEVAEDNAKDVWRVYEKRKKNVGYLATFDAAEGGVDPEMVSDKSFGCIYREPLPEEIEMNNLPVLVAAIRSTLPIIALARSVLPVLRYYNNATLAAERGHGKDNEAFGMTLEDWPHWYMRQSMQDSTRRLRTHKGFDTNTGTRPVMFDKIRNWLDSFTDADNPGIRDDRILEELGAAVLKVTQGGKKKCDHTKKGSLDGVICMGIAAYILQENAKAFECNYTVEEEESRKGNSLMSRIRKDTVPAYGSKRPMGSGVASMGEFL